MCKYQVDGVCYNRLSTYHLQKVTKENCSGCCEYKGFSIVKQDIDNRETLTDDQ